MQLDEKQSKNLLSESSFFFYRVIEGNIEFLVVVSVSWVS